MNDKSMPVDDLPMTTLRRQQFKDCSELIEQITLRVNQLAQSFLRVRTLFIGANQFVQLLSLSESLGVVTHSNGETQPRLCNIPMRSLLYAHNVVAYEIEDMPPPPPTPPQPPHSEVTKEDLKLVVEAAKREPAIEESPALSKWKAERLDLLNRLCDGHPNPESLMEKWESENPRPQ